MKKSFIGVQIERLVFKEFFFDVPKVSFHESPSFLDGTCLKKKNNFAFNMIHVFSFFQT